MKLFILVVSFILVSCSTKSSRTILRDKSTQDRLVSNHRFSHEASDLKAQEPSSPGAADMKVAEEIHPASSLPLVSCSNKKFAIDSDFKQHAPRIAQFNSLSYFLSNCKMIQINPLNYFLFPPSLEEAQSFSSMNCEKMQQFSDEISSEGWEYQYFTGYSGQSEEDIPGLVAFNRHQKIIVVVFRGSISTADFRTDFDDRLGSYPELGIAGQMHRGFVIKYKQLSLDMYRLIDYYLQKLSPEEKQHLSFYITGHSLGAALGSLAIADLTRHYGTIAFGPSYLNTQENKFKAWLLSPPVLCADSLCRDSIHTIVGKHNIIAQFVEGDPVPKATPGISKLFSGVVEAPNLLSATALLKLASKKFSFINAKPNLQYPSFSLGVPAIQNSLRATTEASRKSSAYVVSAPAFLKQFPVMAIGGLHYGSSDKFGNGTYDYRLVDLDIEALLYYGTQVNQQKNCQQALAP